MYCWCIVCVLFAHCLCLVGVLLCIACVLLVYYILHVCKLFEANHIARTQKRQKY